MGLASLAAPRVVRRIGWVRTTTGILLLIGLASVARAALPTTTALIALSIPIGVGAGLGGASLPTAIGDLYQDRRAIGTAIHAFGINIGAVCAAALAVPLASALGGWRGAFAAFGVIGLGLSLVWTLGTDRRSEHTRPPTLSLPLRDPRAWALTSLFALQALCYFGFGAWLSDAYVEKGWSQGTGGGLIALLTAAAVPSSFLVPRIAGRLNSRRGPLLACGLMLIAGSVVLAAWPGLAWAGAATVGLSLGGFFSLCLLLAVDLGQPTRQVAGFAGMMLGLGYATAAVAPVLLGAARDAAGSFQSALWLMVADAGALLVLVFAAHRLLTPTQMAVPQREPSLPNSHREQGSARTRTP
jgi:CP family cyanate transporter-like MFS transporter